MEPPEKGKSGRAGQTGATGDAAGGAATTASAGSSASTVTDQTRFSSDPGRVQALAAQALAQPEVRQGKVEALQQAIGRGEYSVSSGQVADAMASELGGAG